MQTHSSPDIRPEAMADVPGVCELPLTRAVVQYRDVHEVDMPGGRIKDVGLAVVLEGRYASHAEVVDLGSAEVKLLDLELATVAADDDADAGASASGATDCFSGDLCADSEAPSSRSRGVTVYAYDSDSGSGDLHRLLADRNQIAASEGLGGGAAPPLPGEPFELAIVSQTLEHLLNPVRADALASLQSLLTQGSWCAEHRNIQSIRSF